MKLFFQLVFLCFALNLNAQSQHEIEVQGQIDSIMTLYPNCTDYPNDVLVVLDSLLVLLAEIQGDSTNPNLDSISTDYLDAAFLDFLSTDYPNVIQNGQIDPLEASLITDLDLDDLGISYLNGIEHFINLKTLSCQHNNLTSLPDLPSQIESINCQWNEIAFLYPLPESLRNFDMRHNSMTVVPQLPNFIEDLKLCFNDITSITNLPDSLEILYCAYNNLTQLPDFPSKLKTVLCYNNQIAQITAIPESMRTFRIQNNSLIALPPIPSGLETLTISNNPIECVNDYPDQFEDLLGQYPNCERDLIYQISQAIEPWYISIALQEGWNMFGYACPEPSNVEALLSPYVSSIILVKDNNGSAYIPEFAYNGIGDFTPGYGYQLKIYESIQSFSLCDWYAVVLPEDNILGMQEYISQLEDSIEILNQSIVLGCTDETACNYNPEANMADGSCAYAEQGYDCDENFTEYLVGMQAEGGIVFYVDETGQHGLAAAIEDLDTTYQWGCFATSIPGADGQAIGTGYQNTLDIASGCSETPIAASQALGYESEGYSDWYLPSLDELKEIYNTIGYGGLDGNIGGFSSNWYWSSSENNNYGALDVNFGDGSTGNFSAKSKTDRVRVIRSF